MSWNNLNTMYRGLLLVVTLLSVNTSHAMVTQREVYDQLVIISDEYNDKKYAMTTEGAGIRQRVNATLAKRAMGPLSVADKNEAKELLDDLLDFSRRAISLQSKVEFLLKNISDNRAAITGSDPVLNSHISNKFSSFRAMPFQMRALAIDHVNRIYTIVHEANPQPNTNIFDLDTMLADKNVGGDVCTLKGVTLEKQTLDLSQKSIPGITKPMTGQTYLTYSPAIDIARETPMAQPLITWVADIDIDNNSVYSYFKDNLPADSDCKKFSVKNEVIVKPYENNFSVEAPVVVKTWICGETTSWCIRNNTLKTCYHPYKFDGPNFTRNQRAYVSAGTFGDSVVIALKTSQNPKDFKIPVDSITNMINNKFSDIEGLDFKLTNARIVKNKDDKSQLLVSFGSKALRLGKTCQIYSQVAD